MGTTTQMVSEQQEIIYCKQGTGKETMKLETHRKVTALSALG